MKRTTYIILGVLLALLAGMSAIIIYWGTHSGSASDMTVRLEGEERMRPLPACKVIRFRMDRMLHKQGGNDELNYYLAVNNIRYLAVNNIRLKVGRYRGIYGLSIAGRYVGHCVQLSAREAEEENATRGNTFLF